MKRFLLSALAIMATMGSFAQDKVTVNPLKNQIKEVAVPCTKQYKPVAMKPDQKYSAPRKSYESEMWYARPEGTFYLSGQYYDTNQELQSYKYLVLPPFTDVKFWNLSTDAANTQWFMGTTELTEGIDENYNYSHAYSKMPSGYVAYLPTLTKGDDSFQIAEYALICDSVPQYVHAFNYLDGHRYYGYEDGQSAFQSGPDEFDFDDDGEPETFYIESFLQFFDKPASPMLLYDVELWATVPNTNIKNIGDLKLVFRKWEVKEEDGRSVRVLGDTIKILNCTSHEFESDQISATAKVYPGSLVFAAEEKDAFGTPTATPFVLDCPYAITLSGFGLDEMDVRFYFTDQGECVEEFESWATPTYLVCCDEDGNTLGQLRYENKYTDSKTGETVRYCYSIVFMFDVIFDGMKIEEGTEAHKAVAEGGDTETGDEDTMGVTWLYTNLPIFEMEDEEAIWTDNYDFEGIPEWAGIRIDPTYYENAEYDDFRGLNLIWFEVEPLPEGVEGRSATIKVVSATGMESAIDITIVQGKTEGDSEDIRSIQFDADGKFVKSYNLAGQTMKNLKGIAIQNGKKFVVK